MLMVHGLCLKMLWWIGLKKGMWCKSVNGEEENNMVGWCCKGEGEEEEDVCCAWMRMRLRL